MAYVIIDLFSRHVVGWMFAQLLASLGALRSFRRTAVEHALAHIAARKGSRARYVGVR
jgi:transposase InsO family protein